MRQSAIFEFSKRYSKDSKRFIRSLQMSPFRWLFDVPASLLFGRNLRVLATLYGSDKWNTHWYAQHYEHHFRHLRRKPLTILEIGIGGYDDPKLGGGSLRMWRNYFPNARIHGIDICDKSPHESGRIRVHQGSQVDFAFLDRVIGEIGRPDIIIDDGSHMNEHVIATFQHLFPVLADDGYYVVEDTQTSYWPDGHVTERNSQKTSMGYFKALVDGLNWEEYFGDYQPTPLDLTITGMSFYHNLVFLKKGDNREGSLNRTWNADKEEWKAVSRSRQVPVDPGNPL